MNIHPVCKFQRNITYCRNIFMTPLRQWGLQQCFHFSCTRNCRHPIAIMGVVDTFGHCLLPLLWTLITPASNYVSTQTNKQYIIFKQSNAISNKTLAPFLACLRVLEKHNILFAASISNMVNIVQGGLASGLFLLYERQSYISQTEHTACILF